MVPEPNIQADAKTVEAHLRHITRRWVELEESCLLELVFLTDEDKARVRQVNHYTPDDNGVLMAVDDVLTWNKLKVNAYATVNPVSEANRPAPHKRANASQIVASFFHWADADDGQAAENIRNFVGPKCTFHVLTGTTPTFRPHVYYELEEPTRDLEAWTRTQAAIAQTLKTDPTVVDPPRIMRIAGAVNWPKPQKQAKGYIAEVAQLFINDDRPPVTSESMARAFSAAPASADGGLHIDTGDDYGPALDREREAIKALSGENWNIAVFKLVGSYVRKGLSDGEIHALTDPLTLGGYTVQDTRDEVQDMIDRTRANPGFEGVGEAYATPNFDTPRPIEKIDIAAPGLEWFGDIEPTLTDAYLIKGVLGDGAMSVVYGASNSGKTFGALDIAFHIAAKDNWRGIRINKASVLYLAAEGGRGVANRIVALKKETGVTDAPFALRRAGMDLLHAEADLQAVYDLAKEVRAKGGNRPLLIVIDTLSRVMAGGDENSAADMTALIRNIDAIREATGAHIMLVHHTGKDAAKGARGHSSLRAATDTEIEVQNEDGFRCARVTKQRDYPGGETFAFTLKSVSLGVDQDGDEVTSCVVEVADEADAPVKRRKLTKNQKVLVETFDQLVAEFGRPNPGGAMMPETGRFMTLQMEDFRAACEGKFTAKNTRDAFLTAFDALNVPGGIFCMASGFVWRTDRRINN